MLGVLHQRVLDALGAAIVSGRLPVGHVMLLDSIAVEQSVSRPVAREAVRVLQSLGLVETVKRIGVRVLPMASWNVLDPAVIQWRLTGPGSLRQLRSLTELRTAVEPIAAGLAAANATAAQGAELTDLAAAMAASAGRGDIEAFLRDDVLFHRLVLTVSGNEMFARLSDVVAEVLRGHTLHEATPSGPDRESLDLHLRIAEAIASGRAAEATAAMSAVSTKTLSEILGLTASGPSA